MGDQENRLGRTSPDLQQQFLHLFAGEGVEGAEGLVHQQHTRVGGQGAGDADALSLSAGKLPDTALVEAGQVHQGEHFAGTSLSLGAGHAGQFQTEGDIAEHVLPGQQGVVLEHHAALGAGAADENAVEADAPGAGADEAGDEVEQRGLAAAGRAQGHQQFAGAEVEGNVGQYRLGRAGVLCADALQLE
ncbi:hypothetical protein FQZ97_569240 [compost metagenome]